MKFIPKNSVRKFQEGGAMGGEEMAAPELAAPDQAAAQQDPIMMLAEAAAQALQGLDCQLALQVCLGLLQLIQQMGGGQGAPEGEPVFRRGGILLRRIRK